MEVATDRDDFTQRFIAHMLENWRPGDFFSARDCEAYCLDVVDIWWTENGNDTTPEECAKMDLHEQRKTERGL